VGLSRLSKNTLIVAWSFVAVVAIAAFAFVWIYTESVNQRRLENETQLNNAEVAKLVAKSKRELSKDNLDQAEKIATSAMEVEGATQFENAEALLTLIDEHRANKEQERVESERIKAEEEARQKREQEKFEEQKREQERREAEDRKAREREQELKQRKEKRIAAAEDFLNNMLGKWTFQTNLLASEYDRRETKFYPATSKEIIEGTRTGVRVSRFRIRLSDKPTNIKFVLADRSEVSCDKDGGVFGSELTPALMTKVKNKGTLYIDVFEGGFELEYSPEEDMFRHIGLPGSGRPPVIWNGGNISKSGDVILWDHRGEKQGRAVIQQMVISFENLFEYVIARQNHNTDNTDWKTNCHKK